MPEVTGEKGLLKRKLIEYHNKVSHHNRVEIITNSLVSKLNQLHLLPVSPLCLDIGCGDMKIVELIDQVKPSWNWRCLDIYPAGGTEGRWQRYVSFDGRNIPYYNQAFDLSLLVDVLHHCDNITGILGEAKRVSRYIIIKDHFEYGHYSSTMLKAMDLFGNWAYDVKVPGKYFTRTSFAALCEQLNLEMIDLEIGMDLYGHLPVLNRILKPKWHFIAVLQSK